MPAADAEEIQSMKAVFKEYDKNGDGELDLAEMSNIFKKLGTPMSEEDYASMFQAIDSDSSGTVSFDEFLDWMFPIPKDTGAVLPQDRMALRASLFGMPAENAKKGIDTLTQRLRFFSGDFFMDLFEGEA